MKPTLNMEFANIEKFLEHERKRVQIPVQVEVKVEVKENDVKAKRKHQEEVEAKVPEDEDDVKIIGVTNPKKAKMEEKWMHEEFGDIKMWQDSIFHIWLSNQRAENRRELTKLWDEDWFGIPSDMTSYTGIWKKLDFICPPEEVETDDDEVPRRRNPHRNARRGIAYEFEN